jgi:hypothetical protein
MPYKKIAMTTLRLLWALFLAAVALFFFAVSLPFRLIGSDVSRSKDDDEMRKRMLWRDRN